MTVRTIPIAELKPFAGQPFKIRQDERLYDLTESILRDGVHQPVLVRPLEEGGYEIISGHRRVTACIAAGLQEIPAVVREMTREEAVMMLVDENLTQREEILPSEKAYAYRMKLEAIRHQGKASPQNMLKSSAGEVGRLAGDSREKVRKYVRLTYLIPELLEMVDQRKIAFGPAVEMSFLTEEEQRDLLDAMQREDATPSVSQAMRIRALSVKKELTKEGLIDILSERKGNQVEDIRLSPDLVQKYFRRKLTARDIRTFVEKAVEYYGRHLRARENASRNI